jgi:hypothetical protein
LFKLDPLNAVANSLPGSILHTAVKHNWNITLYLSRLCWRNVVDSRYLGTLVSRLFIGSFSSEKVKQNFELTYEKNSLVDIGFAYNSKRDWASILHSERGLTVFNSTTIYSFVLSKLIELWDDTFPRRLNKHIRTERLWKSCYSQFVKRLIHRRVPSLSKITVKNIRPLPKHQFVTLDPPNWTDELNRIVPAVNRDFDDEVGFDTTGIQFQIPSEPIKITIKIAIVQSFIQTNCNIYLVVEIH